MQRPKGTLDIEYYRGRKTKRSLKYRLQRRTLEVIQAIKKYHPLGVHSILDIGTADSLMLGKIKDEFSDKRCIGLEYSLDLIAANEDKRIKIIQGDAHYLPFADESFNIAIATAVIEHLQNPLRMLSETYRVLFGEGLLILTTPDPFWEHLATAVGHLAKEQHNRVMNLRELKYMFEEVHFQVVESKKFMLSPVGIPFEFKAEKIVRDLGLNFLFANQLIVGKKRGSTIYK